MSVTPAGLPGMAPSVRVRGADFGYGDRPALRDIDFTLDRGEVVAVLGPNGSGKSTLVKGILRLATRTAGSVELFGTPAERFRDWPRVGYVPQRGTIAAGLPVTVREVVTSGRLPRMRRFSRLADRDRQAIDRAIEAVGLPGRARHPVATLSGGQQRRVHLARALAGEPEVLVLDEPMAGVDAGSQDLLGQALRRLVATGTTVLLVAHELGPLEPLIGRVVWMSGGRIAFDGSPQVARREFVLEADPHPVEHGGSSGRSSGAPSLRWSP